MAIFPLKSTLRTTYVRIMKIFFLIFFSEKIVFDDFFVLASFPRKALWFDAR